MGINFSHGDLSMGPWSFANLRKRLAQEIGMDYTRMEGHIEFNDDLTIKSVGRRPWSDYQDPLVPFLRAPVEAASFSPKESLILKRRIQELALRWTFEKDAGFRELALKLAEAMAIAAFKGERFSWIG
jgi:hypothetical protein